MTIVKSLLLLLPVVGLSGILCHAMPTDHIHHQLQHLRFHQPLTLDNGTLVDRDTDFTDRLDKRTVLDNRGCRGMNGFRFRSAITDARLALERTVQRTRELSEWLLTNPEEDPEDDELFSTLLTFEAIFGRVFVESHGQENKDNSERIVGVQLETARKLHAALTSQNGLPPHVEFYCDHTQWLRHIEDNLYEDIRPVDRGGQITRRIDHVCSNDEASPVAFTTSFNPQSPTPNDVITFCPKALNFWTTETFRSLREMAFPSDVVHLDHVSQHLMGVSMLHELTHLWTVLENQKYSDVEYKGGDNDKAYGFAAIQDIGDEASRRNADSFAYYATAMFLDHRDWHTGFAREYEDILGIPEDNHEEDLEEAIESSGGDSGDDS